jgi:phenylalanyl-tRNA synthetase beta subunit
VQELLVVMSMKHIKNLKTKKSFHINNISEYRAVRGFPNQLVDKHSKNDLIQNILIEYFVNSILSFNPKSTTFDLIKSPTIQSTLLLMHS